MTERIFVIDTEAFLMVAPKAHAAPAKSAAAPVPGGKVGRAMLTAFQQDQQRRFAFGYTDGSPRY